MAMWTLTDEQVAETKARVSFLYQSEFAIDNVTAILMDSSVGSSGLFEAVARQKAHSILSRIEFNKNQKELLAGAGDKER